MASGEDYESPIEKGLVLKKFQTRLRQKSDSLMLVALVVFREFQKTGQEDSIDTSENILSCENILVNVHIAVQQLIF